MRNLNIPSKPKHRDHWVKYQLNLKDYTLAALAHKLGLVRSAPAQVFRFPYPKMEREMAQIIGVPPEIIWPERYNQDGTPNRRAGRKSMKHVDKDNFTTAQPVRNGKSRG